MSRSTGKFNICIAQPGNYDHSPAFLELGELIYYSLKELGCEANLTFKKIDPKSTNIIIGCHLVDPSIISSLPKSTIILNTEQLYRDTMLWNENVFSFARQFEVWDYNELNIAKFKELGIENVKLFKLGFQKELVRLDGTKTKDIDVLFYGSINKRRKDILLELEAEGLNIKFLFGVYGQERDHWVERSKVVLNHHHYNSQLFEIVRVFYLLTNSTAVLAEVNDTTSIDPMYKEGIWPAKYDELVGQCKMLVNDHVLLEKIRKNAFNAISKYPQTRFTQELI